MDYFAYIMAEISNEDMLTDYASEPQYIGLNGAIGGCTWSLSDDLKTQTIAKAEDGNGEMLKYKNEADSSRPWSKYSEKITSIVIDEGVTFIGHYSFCKMNKLEKVTIPKSV